MGLTTRSFDRRGFDLRLDPTEVAGVNGLTDGYEYLVQTEGDPGGHLT
jgi:hypothetical protein